MSRLDDSIDLIIDKDGNLTYLTENDHYHAYSDFLSKHDGGSKGKQPVKKHSPHQDLDGRDFKFSTSIVSRGKRKGERKFEFWHDHEVHEEVKYNKDGSTETVEEVTGSTSLDWEFQRKLERVDSSITLE